MLDGTLFFVKSARYRNRGKDVFPDFVFLDPLSLYHVRRETKCVAIVSVNG